MKKTLLFAAIVSLLLCSCTSKEKQARKLIKEYLAEELRYPSTYKAFSFGTLDSVFESPELDIIKLSGKYMDTATYYQKSANYQMFYIYLNKSNACMDSLKKYEDIFTHDFIGWSMDHEYQYSDKKGNEQTVGVFYFDQDVTKVLREE